MKDIQLGWNLPAMGQPWASTNMFEELNRRFSFKRIIGFLILVGAVIGWCWNIIKIFKRPNEGWLMKLIRIVGIPVPLIGIVLGYIG